jgi:hypothetical protein
VFVSAILSPTQNSLPLFRIRLQFGIQGKRAFHLDDVNDEDLAFGLSGQPAGQLDRILVGIAAVYGDEYSIELHILSHSTVRL